MDIEAARARLIAHLSSEIKDQRVLEAMARVPRERFIPAESQHLAFQDMPLPIGYGQTISQPFIIAMMTEALKLTGNEKVLEVGTGSGYQAAILAELDCEVYTIEIVPELGKRSRDLLAELGYSNVHVKIGDGYEGWEEHAPFDKIIVTCAPEKVPKALIDQLAPDGRIVVPVGGVHEIQYLVVLKFNKMGKLIKDYKYPVRFVPMTGKVQD